MSEPARSDRDIAGNLRQLIAALEHERQALAGLDADALIEATDVKEQLCLALAPLGGDALDAECRALARTAQHLNEVNRRVRNLLSANVAARLDALGEVRGGTTCGEIAHA